MLKRVHKNCGGTIVSRKCLKCGKKFGLIRYFVTKDISDEEDKFDPKAYRRRISRGDDLHRDG